MCTTKPRMATVSRVLDTNRSIYSGTLQKRCRLSWRPRYVELISDPADYSGPRYSFQLLIFDPRRRILKDRIRMDDIVTIRASRDCFFQIFLSSGKILQFRSENMETQAYWMAMLKVGLGRGSIFHVRVNTAMSNMEHALLYSIGVNLPAHRIGQLDRVLVLASPINDINMHAWDLNRVKRFTELDIGIRMEMCSSCVRMLSTTVTLIMEKQFIKDCMGFLCREARISDVPIEENGLLFYVMSHTCGYITPPPGVPPPPPYSSEPEPGSEIEPPREDKRDLGESQTAVSAVVIETTTKGVSPLPSRKISEKTHFDFSEDDWHQHDSQCSSESGYRNITSSFSEDDAFLPPRTIPRKNYECSLPAVAQPYINFTPHLFSSGSSRFEAPYQISSRIIITDSGDVQFERNVLGNAPKNHGGFHFKKQLPLPPRTTKVHFDAKLQHSMPTTQPHDVGFQPTTTTNSPFRYPLLQSHPPGSLSSSPISSAHNSPILSNRNRTRTSPTRRASAGELTQNSYGNVNLTRRHSDVSDNEDGEYIIPFQPVDAVNPPWRVASPLPTAQPQGEEIRERKNSNDDYEDVLSVNVMCSTSVPAPVKHSILVPRPQEVDSEDKTEECSDVYEDGFSVKIKSKTSDSPVSSPVPVKHSAPAPHPRPPITPRRSGRKTYQPPPQTNQDTDEQRAYQILHPTDQSNRRNRPALKVTIRGDDQAGLLDRDEWSEGYANSKWMQDEIQKKTLTLPKQAYPPTLPRPQRPPVPKPRSRTFRTGESVDSASIGPKWSKLRSKSESVGVGESEML